MHANVSTRVLMLLCDEALCPSAFCAMRHSAPLPSPLATANEQLQEKVQASLLAVEEAVDRQNLNPPFQGTSGGDQEEGACQL